jgi:hypothetical protein
MIERIMPEFKQAGKIDPDLLPMEECLSADFKSAIYHKRSKIDPVAYHTRGDKPYLELFFADLGNPSHGKKKAKARYTLKLIIYDFKGIGIYPIYHEEETFKPLYDPEEPIAKTEGGVPYLNYNKGRYIPFILGNFAAMRENRAFTFSTGLRQYGTYKPANFSIEAPANLKRDPKKTLLGFVHITSIGPKGKIRGIYKIRMLHESCTDPFAISHCRLLSNYVEGRFTAAPFRPDKKIMQQMMDQEANPDNESNVLKPREKLTPADAPSTLKPKLGSAQLKPKVGAQAPPAGSVLILTDVPRPRKHKGLLGYECGDPVLSACRTADRTFAEYLACMEKNNFASNKTKDKAKIEQARQSLQKCDSLYMKTYEVKARQCKQLFIDDEDCLE